MSIDEAIKTDIKKAIICLINASKWLMDIKECKEERQEINIIKQKLEKIREEINGKKKNS